MSSSLEAFIRSLPKVEVHLHLEGAIPLDALWELVKKYRATAEVKSLRELEKKFEYRDFPHFIETWTWKNGFLREYDDFELIAERVAIDLASQNIRYVEAFYSAADFVMMGHSHVKLETSRITEALRKGLDKVDAVEVRLVADLVRDYGPERGQRWLDELREVRELGVIGIGIGGSEHDYPPEPYAEVYENARSYGFRTSAHAGEAAGTESIWGAIKKLKVDRIGHGTRAVEDPKLMDHIGAHQIPIESCPISNLRTGVVKNIEDHPIRKFFDEGLVVSVNTDDPKMFNNSLVDEFSLLVGELGFRQEDIIALLENAISSTWASEERKRAMTRELREASR